MSRFLITGAAGLLGRNIANQLLKDNCEVIATSRNVNKTAFHDSNLLSIIEGDLTDSRFVDELVNGVDVVVNCAAKTTNWGSVDEFERGNVTTARNLAEACAKRGAKRLLHVSSLAVYGHPKLSDHPITEADPVGQRLLTFDRYVQSKIAAENAVRQLGDKATIIRPTWFIGPGDQVFVPSLVRKLKKGAIWLLGSGDNLLNGLAVDDVARGAIAAATELKSGGQTFNLCSMGDITQLAFLDMICQHHRIPKVRRRIPLWIAWSYASTIEHSSRILGQKNKPPMTRHDLTVFSRPPRYSYERATEMLGWRPLIPLGAALQETLSQELSS